MINRGSRQLPAKDSLGSQSKLITKSYHEQSLITPVTRHLTEKEVFLSA